MKKIIFGIAVASFCILTPLTAFAECPEIAPQNLYDLKRAIVDGRMTDANQAFRYANEAMKVCHYNAPVMGQTAEIYAMIGNASVNPLDELKSQGNVVCFRNLKDNTDEAITLFSNKEAIEEIVIQPYEDYIESYNKAVSKVLEITPTFDSVNDLVSEDEELEFVKAFRELMRVKNVLTTFTEFSYDDLQMDEQTFENYKSKYLDLYESIKSDNQKEKVSILNDIDFEVELIRKDEINVAYILQLLAKLLGAKSKDQEKQRKAISDMMESDTQLRSKKELIERFIDENLPLVTDSDNIEDAFDTFWTIEKKKAIKKLSNDDNLNFEKLVEVVSDYLYTKKEPLRDEVIALMNERPSLKERATASKIVTSKIISFVETFIEGMG